MSGIVLAGTHSGCGKTTITLGILAALKKKGLTVQSFKAGPDFIDTGLHRLITGRPSRNLDIWMCGEDYVRDCYKSHSLNCDLSIVEGVMGLYDGEFSTARLATLLRLPIILIVDAYGMAESAGAIVNGFIQYSSRLLKDIQDLPNISGVIFNRIASDRHYKRVIDSVRDVPVLGYLPRDLNFEIPHRHLGLTTAEERPFAEENVERLANAVLRHIDMDKVIEKYRNLEARHPIDSGYHPFQNSKVKIAIAYDRAFCFYYEDNLDLLRNEGAEIVTFSLMSDSHLPEDVDAIYIGGGYPELYAEELSKNQSMLEAIHNWADSGKPMYAECGGLMYLSKGIYDFEGNFSRMAGVFPFETEMKRGRAHLGYRDVLLNDDCIKGKKEDKIRGHEFHYSEIKPSVSGLQSSDITTCYSVFDNRGQPLQKEGYKFKNVLASYTHIHFGSNSNIAKSFINFIKETQWKT